MGTIGRPRRDMDLEALAFQHVDDSIAVLGQLRAQSHVLVEIATLLVKSFRSGNSVFSFGNGGSAADSQHFAAELAGRLYGDRPPLPAYCLAANVAILTAVANDYGYEKVFARQVEGYVHRGDVVIGFSTSGESPNVLRAVSSAKELGCVTVAFTGAGGALGSLADYVLAVQSTTTPRVQEAHALAGHIICAIVEREMFGI